ncbi:MAG TPA: Gfo/Idh/MocA family oxidoreductase [Clostridia bacterium]|nr:Gfo/Idh/MocA family oxidoreductase [Clostridia bacterium]
MNDQPKDTFDYNRRDFLKSGSLATMMAMLGGVELIAQTNAPADAKASAFKVKVGVIGLGPWGREILNTLARKPEAEIAAVCDKYPAYLRRANSIAPGAAQMDDYQKLLADKEIKAVVVATPTHQHREIVEAALKAGKHVYCEAPLAHTMEDARAIAAAAKAAGHLIFQPGLQMRSDPQRHFLLPFIRSGAIGQWVMARAQWHKKHSWRATSPNPDREKEINWRLSKETSLGLTGEMGIHPIDQVTWFLGTRPTAVSGFGSVVFWKDGRDVPDTVQAVLEFPAGVNMMYHATLANSFDSEYEMFYGSDAAVMMRESKAWMFKEVDSPLLGWEVYARKESFYKETGIMLMANASKSSPTDAPAEEVPFTKTPLSHALGSFLRNAYDLSVAAADFIETMGADDAEALQEHLSKVRLQPAAGLADGFISTVIAIKTNEAVMTRQRVEIKPDLYELA